MVARPLVVSAVKLPSWSEVEEDGHDCVQGIVWLEMKPRLSYVYYVSIRIWIS
jgi:hypothetical protein